MPATLSVAYDLNRSVLNVSGHVEPFPAGSLEARQKGNLLAVANPNQPPDHDLICQWLDFSAWSIDGATYPDAASAFAALASTCSRAPARSPVVTATASPSADGLPAGSPVALSRSNGQMLPARADTYALSFVAGLAGGDVAGGFSASAVRTYVDRADWTPVAGSQSLALGQPYFLGLAGGITLTPGRTPGVGNGLVRVGIPVSPTRLAFVAADPVQL